MSDRKPLISVGMIVLNEEEFIENNLKQHYNWIDSEVHQIIIVEGAVELFPKRNITSDGLSTDRTSEIIRSFPDPEKKVVYIQGYWKDKSHQRNQYISRIKDDTDYLVVIDTDEFYTYSAQKKLSLIFKNLKDKHSILLHQIHLWMDKSQQVIGGYWAVPHLRIYRWTKGCYYGSNHNEVIAPSDHNYNVRDDGFVELDDPVCLHFGFVRSYKFCRDKQDYYYSRGEKITRPMYSDCREAWFTWKPGSELPHDAKVIPYYGELPELML